ncbi:matrix metalloproteinase 1 [Arctopsyche grandis]|uniref:matrix metalloproteinase 1 n=1 Tax=Arctopsyche grandis TaxID=121162 RepID=UPI00406D79AF
MADHRRESKEETQKMWRTRSRCPLAVMRVALILCLPYMVNSAPVTTDTQAMMYLSQFGYLNPNVRNPSSGALMDADALVKAISEFQSFAGVNVTGSLDQETTELMALPRCGVKDKVGFGSSSRSKRYALQGSRWRVKNLKYKISKYPRLLTKQEVDDVVSKAFNVWSGYTDLTFTHMRTGQVHIEIRFEKGEHGDGDPFDGPGGTLAHAYFPVYGGDAHFDDAEQWSVNSYRGTNLFQVAAHEFGHSLGLSHSDVKSALMAPFYRGFDPSFQLDSDDIQGIQALYGRKSDFPSGGPGNPVPNFPAKSPGTEDERLCKDSKIDTLFNSAEGVTYAFKGDYYYKLTEDGVAPGYPRLISKTWLSLPGHIDAAFTYKNGKTYFFKGSKYWRFEGTRLDGEYPKDISDGFTGIPDNVDAALVWSGNGKIYFYKGSKFWRFDPAQRPPVKSTYPKPLSNWEGVPDHIDAALHYTNGYTYFFKDGAYYRFNDRTFSVDAADPAFPRSSGFWWFGCKSAPSGTIGGLSSQKAYPSPDEDSDITDIVFDAGGTDERDSPRSTGKSSGSNSRTGLSVLIFSVVLYVSSKIVI